MILYNVKDFKKLPRRGRILALDIGTKKIGVAICDDTQTIATPKAIIKRQSNEKDFNVLLSIIQENHIVMIVIGYPLKMDGAESEITKFVAKFIENFDDFLQKILPKIYLIKFDERLSSFEARSFSFKTRSRQDEYDDISASVILEHFLHDFRQSLN